jgi:hypothetical protein
MERAYSHEVSSSGYWPGGAEEGAFYAYSYPQPADVRDQPVEPPHAFFDESLGEFLLPYHAVRTASDPDDAVLTFLQSTYDIAANLAGWAREQLEAPSHTTVPGDPH